MVQRKRLQNVSIRKSILQKKSEGFSTYRPLTNPLLTKSWIDRFKRRYHIISSRMHEEADRVSKIKIARMILGPTLKKNILMVTFSKLTRLELL